MNTPHKHAAVIKAWADGAEIESRPPGRWSYETNEGWRTANTPTWYVDYEYRVKPTPSKWQREKDAQAAGKMVQFRSCPTIGSWTDGNWCFDSIQGEYRIKPVPVKVPLGVLLLEGSGFATNNEPNCGYIKDNLMLTFTDGYLTAVELL